jgi:hypothetical protein
MSRAFLRRLSLRSIVAWGLLSAIGFLFARAITEVLLPFIQSVVDTMQSDYIAHLSILDTRAGLKIAMSCTAERELALPRGTIMPFLGTFNCATTDAVHALVPLVIFAVAVASWPTSSRRETFGRVIGSLLLLPVVVALTTPPLLVGLVESTLHPKSLSADPQFAALIQPWVFMEMGGRWLLPLAAAALCIRFDTIAVRFVRR